MADISDNTSSSDVVVDTAIASNPLLTAQTVNTPSAPAANTNNIVATTIEASASANQGFSNNSGGSGQGGQTASTPLTVANVNASSAPEQSASANFAKTLKAATSQPVAEQILVQVKTAVKNGESKIEIRLDPAELGKLTIKLETGSDGKTGISIIADSKSTLDLLQRDSRNLQQALADAGLSTDAGSLSFNLRGGDQQQQDQQQASSGYKKMQPEEEVIPLAAVTRSYTLQMSDGLDIRI
jgi:flagellar hook-length control protein FliK